MASIKEYFDKAFEYDLTATRQIQVTARDNERLQITVQVHFNFDAGVKYLSFFLPRHERWKELCKDLVNKREFLLIPNGDVNLRIPPPTYVFGGFKFLNNAPQPPTIAAAPLCEPIISSDELQFSGVVFAYTENHGSEVDLALLKDFAKGLGLRVRFRGPDFARERSLIEKPVAFISHDSRDKDQIARPLAVRLQQMLCPVWYDEFALVVGDSLRDKIENGLKECAKCVLILSPNFLSNKRWTKVEYDSIFTREIIEETNVMLPVWCGVTPKEVYEYSPTLALKIGVNWNLGLEEVARRLRIQIESAAQLPTPSKWFEGMKD